MRWATASRQGTAASSLVTLETPRVGLRVLENLKTDLMEELSERISVSEGGKPKKLSKQRALVKSLTAKAIKGDARAISILINLMIRVLEVVEADQDGDLINENDLAILDNFLAHQNVAARPRNSKADSQVRRG